MDFYINKNATLPILKLELINDGRNENGNFYDNLQSADITFCMTDANTGIKKIGNKKALCILKEPSSDCLGKEYYMGYKFTERETKTAATYYGTFTIRFNEGAASGLGTLIVPIKDELYIHILGN